MLLSQHGWSARPWVELRRNDHRGGAGITHHDEEVEGELKGKAL
jgi:hypothetical protein